MAAVAGVGAQVPPARADAAVVLGAAVWGRGRPSPVLARRCARAAALRREGRVDWVCTTGGVGRNTPPAEGRAAAQWLVREGGVPEARILVEDTSHTTWENLSHLAPSLRAHRITTLFVVSDGYHLARGVRIAERLGFRAWGVAADTEGGAWGSVKRDPLRWLGETRWLLLEWLTPR